MYSALCGVVAKAKKSYGGKSKSADGGAAARLQVEEFEAKMHAAHVERYESWRTQRRAEGHVFDDDYEERLKAAEREAEAAAEREAEEEEEDDDDEHPLGPLDGGKKAREEEADEDADEDADEEEEEEEENDENDPEPSPAPVKKTSRRAAPKAKKADAVKVEEAPARSSRRALRANR